MIYAEKTTELIAKLLGIKKHDVLVASTGIIGKPLPYEKIVKAAPALVKGLSTKGGTMAAKAIMTTDKMIKEIAVQIKLSGKKVTIGGCAKGSGMIQPNMATTLGFVVTDAVVSPAVLRSALKRAINRSYNRISVDGDTSTNDTVVVLANGASGVKPSAKAFEAALTAGATPTSTAP